MATEEGLRIRIGVPVDALRKGMAKAKAIISGTTKEIASESKAVESASRSWNAMGKFIFQQTYERKRLIQQVQQGIGSWKLEARAVEEVANKSLPALQRGTRGAASTLTSFSRIVQDAPYGIIGIGNNITQFAEQFQYLRQNTGSASSALKALGSSILGTGGLTLGISLLVTGITTLTQKYGSLGAAIDAFLKPLTAQQKFQKELREETIKSIQSIQDEAVAVKRLYTIATSLTVPMNLRKEAVVQLRGLMPGYLKDFKDEQVIAGEAASAYQEFNRSLVEIAKTRALTNKITSNQSKDIDLEAKQQEIQLKLDATRASNDKNFTRIRAERIRITTKGFDNEIKLEKELAEVSEQRALISSQNAVWELQANKRLDDLKQSMANREAKESEAEDQRTKRAAERQRTVSDVLRDLQKEMSAIDEYNKLVGMSSDNLAKEKLTVLNKAFEDIAKIGGPQARKELDRLSKLINTLNASIIGDIKPLSTRQDIFQRSPIPMSKIPIDIQLVGVSEAQNKLLNQLKPIQNAVETFDLSLTKQVNDVINNSVIGGIGNIAAGIGEALGSGKIEPIIHSFVNTISGFLTQMGELLIAQGVSIEAFKKSLESFQGIPAIIAGGALIVAAGAFRAFASKGIGSFATGGTAYGPQLAMIGDNPGRQEHIIPSEVLDKLGASNSYPSEIVLRAHGADLVGVLRMGQNYNGRING